MKRPRIKIFGKEHKVLLLEFNNDGLIERVVYQVSQDVNKTVFRSDTVINKSLTSERKIQEPTEHPFRNYAYAPDLESLLC